MKVQFKSEDAMNEFRDRFGAEPNHNSKFVTKYGMSTIEVEPDTDGCCVRWWDVLGSDGGLDFTIHVAEEGYLFNIVE